MRIRYLTLVFMVVYLSAGAEGIAKETYAFIKSKELKQMNQVILGFTGSFPNAAVVVLDLKGRRDTDKIKNFVKAERPSVIICLGALAARATIQVEKKIPIIFSMVINYKRYPDLNQKNVTGISMEIPPASLFTQFRMLMPRVRSIGVPFHPAVSAEIVRDASEASHKMGIRLVPIRVTDPARVDGELSRHAGEYSGLWMLADTKLYSAKTRALSDLIRFSKRMRKPLLAFSEAFLKPGAFFSISIDYRSLGSQIALISRRLVQDGTPPSHLPAAPPVGTYTVINRNIAELLLGRDFDESIYEEVDKIYPEDE